MPEFLNQYWIVIVIALVLVALSLFLFVPKRDPRPPEVDNGEPNKPLEPRKPDIVAAKRNRFDAPPVTAPIPATPSTAAALPPLAAATPDGDALSLMKGVGPKLVAKLNALGVSRYDQIAGWSEADIDRIDEQLGTFKGRIRRDDWVDQARLLAAGDRAGFEAKYGALG